MTKTDISSLYRHLYRKALYIYGWNVIPDTSGSDICYWNNVYLMGIIETLAPDKPTPQPTHKPTSQPTHTDKPTLTPTYKPSHQLTSSSISNPIHDPTSSPVLDQEQPTDAPTNMDEITEETVTVYEDSKESNAFIVFIYIAVVIVVLLLVICLILGCFIARNLKKDPLHKLDNNNLNVVHDNNMNNDGDKDEAQIVAEESENDKVTNEGPENVADLLENESTMQMIDIEKQTNDSVVKTVTCTNCGQVKEGKLFDGDGLLYCNECWSAYNKLFGTFEVTEGRINDTELSTDYYANYGSFKAGTKESHEYVQNIIKNDGYVLETPFSLTGTKESPQYVRTIIKNEEYVLDTPFAFGVKIGRCKECVELKEGKILEADAQFYCNLCLIEYDK